MVEVEDSVAGFLGVHIGHDEQNHSMKMTQTRLTKRIVKALNLEHKASKHTPMVKHDAVKYHWFRSQLQPS